MSLGDVIDSVRRSERTLTVFNPGTDGGDAGEDTEPGKHRDGDGGTVESSEVVAELATVLDDRNVAVRRETTRSGRPKNVAVLEMNDVVLATIDVESLLSLLGGANAPSDGLGFDTGEYADVLRHLQEATFTSYDREKMLDATREIEDRAFRTGYGRLRAGFQTLDRLRSQREEYEELASRGLEVTVYATPGNDGGELPDVEIHTPDAAEIADHWFVVYDGGDEPSQACALLAEERADGYYGVWTYDPDIVDWIGTHLADRYE